MTSDITVVLDAANKEFTKNGFQLEDYDVEVDKQMSQGSYWMIWYEKKGLYKIPGGKHGIQIDKDSGRAIFMKGE